MKLRIRYFGRFAVEIGKFSEEIEIQENAKVRDLIELLRKKYPQLKHEVIEISIRGRYASEDSPLEDEVAVYSMISGG